MEPADNTSIFFLEDEAVLFHAPAQALYRLNTSAAFIWCLLEQGCEREGILAQLVSTFSLSGKTATKYLHESEKTFGELGVIKGFEKPAPEPEINHEIQQSIEYSDDQFVIERRYRLLTTRFLLRFSDNAQHSLIAPVLNHLSDIEDIEQTTTVDILEDKSGRITLCRDRVPLLHCDNLNQLAPKAKSLVWQTAVHSHDFFLDIHAGVVGDGDQCILLPAPPGSGKSSLTLALAHHGYEFFSDEVALLHEPGFQVESVPLAACVKESGLGLISQYYPEVCNLESHMRSDGKIVRYLPPDAANIPANGTKRPVAAIIFPRFDPSAAFDFSPMSKLEALVLLLQECLIVDSVLNPKKIEDLLNWIKQTPCYRLTNHNLDKAVKSIQNLNIVPKV